MMAYSSRANRFVLFGGWNGEGLNATWVFDPVNQTWTNASGATTPSSRGDANFAYDSADDVFVLFGGWHELDNGTYVRLDDTWTFSLANGTWVERHPSRTPSARSDSAVAYDSAESVVFLFGGFTGSVYLGDGWAYSYANDTWFQRASPAMPSPRADGRMVYDSKDHQFLLFGGNDYSGPNLAFHHLGDTWEYSWADNRWTQIATPISPGPRDYSTVGYAPDANAILLVGGYGNRTILGDTWAFDLTANTWSRVSTQLAPPPRFAGVGGYDARDGFLVLFSGLGDQGLLGDTWILTYLPAAGPSGSGNPGEGGILAAASFIILAVALVVAIRWNRPGSQKTIRGSTEADDELQRGGEDPERPGGP